ncbi:response regulator transcription factor [Enterococcus sp. BWM-S5]|uniref:Response regulator transcription factor n=1 Tax=Enterococcus larvae TaxID=2794352 RepID=A0ABS4CH83_9ENTE|nr:response regulator transcription factor [Enterococcus larvae]MBP1045975.1 response regulator transcription factor [Enterococcus larvae]
MPKLLIVEDNRQIVEVLKKYLIHADYEVNAVYDGKEALASFERQRYDLILLDIMLPELDGYAVCRKIRETSTVPIIMITAKSEDADRILGLEIGADDYIVKPFSTKEVVARVNALLRRVQFEKAGTDRRISYEDIRIDIETKEVAAAGSKLALTKKEFDLLLLFVQFPKKVFTRENLLDSVWGVDYFGDARTVDSHIKRLRAKLKNSDSVCHIQTIWGAGYAFEVTT